MKKSTLMLLAGAVIAFFAYRYFSKKKAPATSNEGTLSKDTVNPSLAPNIAPVVQDPNLVNTTPATRLTLDYIRNNSKGTWFTYTGPKTLTKDGYMLSPGDKIQVTVVPSAVPGVEDISIVGIMGNTNYGPFSMNVNIDYLTK